MTGKEIARTIGEAINTLGDMWQSGDALGRV